MKKFKGKAIYQPAGKAAEYSEWACNFYVGCSGGCTYCYLKKGRGAAILGGNIPVLKKCFRNEDIARKVFIKELRENIDELKKHGLFFSFTTDPMLPETINLTVRAVNFCHVPWEEPIPVQILTKCTWWVDQFIKIQKGKYSSLHHDKIAFGFTLTGHDGMEPGTSTNQERIEAMRKLHEAGFKTFASIEPVLNYANSLKMIEHSYPYCDLFKIGLESGEKYSSKSVYEFVNEVLKRTNKPIYFKDSLLKAAGIQRESLPGRCISRDFKLHEL